LLENPSINFRDSSHHQRCWQRHCRIENKAHKEQVKKMKKRLWKDRQIAAFASLGADARLYLQGLIEAKIPIKKNISKILDLKNEYGSAAIIMAIQKTLPFNRKNTMHPSN
jgi:hypothetical protein